jgi:hypothetical protein
MIPDKIANLKMQGVYDTSNMFLGVSFSPANGVSGVEKSIMTSFVYNFYDQSLLQMPDVDYTFLREFVAEWTGVSTGVGRSPGRMLYLSVVVITTLGLGDIVPITDRARAILGVEAICGIVLAGLFLNAVAWRGSLAVGTPIAERPPHRSERAQFGHSAPTSGV